MVIHPKVIEAGDVVVLETEMKRENQQKGAKGNFGQGKTDVPGSA